ncbi:MAG: hypothetical protein QOF50_1095 [Gaiellaceae bacterium]|jgi:hypothetical protein|nr:hypothetical protein [Gaiellaceae bacterium]
MGGRRWILNVAVSLVFGAFGLFELAFGRGDDRLWGLMTFLLFGVGCVTAFAMPLADRKGSGGFRLGTARRGGARTPALIFPFSRTKLRLAGVATVAMAAAGVLIAIVGGGAGYLAIGVLCAVVFGAMALAAVLNELRNANVAFLPEGVLCRGVAGSSFIPWDAIDSVDVIELRGTPMVAVRATDRRAVELARFGGWLAGANRRLTGADLTYAGLEAPGETLVEAIDHYCEHPAERARIGSEIPPRLRE